MATNALSNQFLVAKSTNPNYHVHIRCLGLGFELVADMPEQTAYAIGVDYEAQLPSSTSDLGFTGAGAYVTGTHASMQALTRQIWRNSSPIEIPLVLQFNAKTDANQEVYRPMRLLEALAMPTLGEGSNTGFGPLDSFLNWGMQASGLLIAPNSGGNIMALSIGRMLNLSEVLLVSCNCTYNSQLSKGFPISGEAEVVFRTPKVLSRAEWLLATGTAFS